MGRTIFSFLYWDALSRIGKSALVRHSYFWLVVTPIAAQILSTSTNTVELTSLGRGLQITLTLPFSWKIFYFSATFFAGGGTIYLLFCPRFLKDANDPAMAQQTFERDRINEWIETQSYENGDTDAKYIFKHRNSLDKLDFFRMVYQYEVRRRPVMRAICAAMYAIGGSLLFYVFLQNLAFVITGERYL